jgi:hypothetical protein
LCAIVVSSNFTSARSFLAHRQALDIGLNTPERDTLAAAAAPYGRDDDEEGKHCAKWARESDAAAITAEVSCYDIAPCQPYRVLRDIGDLKKQLF